MFEEQLGKQQKWIKEQWRKYLYEMNDNWYTANKIDRTSKIKIIIFQQQKQNRVNN